MENQRLARSFSDENSDGGTVGINSGIQDKDDTHDPKKVYDVNPRRSLHQGSGENGKSKEITRPNIASKGTKPVKKMYPDLEEEKETLRHLDNPLAHLDLPGSPATAYGEGVQQAYLCQQQHGTGSKEGVFTTSGASEETVPLHKEEISSGAGIHWCWLVFALIFAVGGAFVVLPFGGFLSQAFGNSTHNSSLKRDNTTGWEIFEKELDAVKSSYPEQHWATWDFTATQMEEVLKTPDPEKPAIILFIAENTTLGRKKLSAVANKIADCARKAYLDKDYSILDGHDLAKVNADDAMHKVDDAFRENFINKLQHVMLVENIDAIPTKSLILFLSLMDHENSDYKDGVMLMTAVSNEPAPELDDTTVLSQMENFARDHFSKIWKGPLPIDTINAILSRILATTLLIR